MTGNSGNCWNIGGAESQQMTGNSEMAGNSGNCWNIGGAESQQMAGISGNGWKFRGRLEFQGTAGISGNDWNFRELAFFYIFQKIRKMIFLTLNFYNFYNFFLSSMTKL